MRAITTLTTSMGMLVLVTGCTVGPDFYTPNPPTITRFTETPMALTTKASNTPGGQAQHFMPGEIIPRQWWQAFGCKALDQLITQALVNSPTVMSAKAKLSQAQEALNAQIGQTLYPALDGSASAIRQQVNLQAFGISAFPNPSPFTLYNIGASVSYTFDLFGANRRELESLRAEVDYQRFELMASQMTLAANIVTAVIRSASLKEQISVTQDIIEMQEKQLSITEKRYQSGGVAQLDVLSQSTLLTQTKATLSPLQKQFEQTRHQIAIYLGKAPSEASLPDIHLSDLTLPTDLPVSLPSVLVRQRPDIQAAQALLHQACANVGVATANLFPKITITGNLATEAPAIKKLFEMGSSAWNIGPTLMQPLFHGGALLAKRRSSIAALYQATAAYQETVLQGIQNVADILKALEYDAKTLQAKTTATNEAIETYAITSKRYQAGGVSYVALLDSQRQYYQTQLDEVLSIADRYADTAALFLALGGGWY